jgi:hypothetical protein
VPASQHGYSYVHNNPVNLSDPSGEFVPLLPLIAGGFVIGAVTGVTWDVMVNQGKGGLDNLHNILNPHYYCDVNWGQAGFTAAGGSLIGVVAAPAMGMASAAATGAYNATPGAYAHWLYYSTYKYPWLGKAATTTATAVGLADTVSDNILRVRALLGDPYAQSVMAEAMLTWNPTLALRTSPHTSSGFTNAERDYIHRALRGDLDNLLGKVECHGAALCLNHPVGGINMIPTTDLRLVANKDFNLIGTLDTDVHRGLLQPGDLLTLHDTSRMGSIRPIGSVNSFPLHSSRVLDNSSNSAILFNKTNVGSQHPFTSVTLEELLTDWNPEYISVYRR